MSEQSQRPAWLQADLIIAVCALVISTLACVASVLQARVIAQQLSATVWPYLDFGLNSTSNTGKAVAQDETSIIVTNDGLGPAIVQAFSVTVDGSKVPSVDAAITRMVPPRRTVAGSTTSAGISTGSVIRAGESVTLIGIRGTKMVAPFRKHLSGLSIAICYCSVLRTCWLVRTHEVEPHDVASCSA